MSSIKQKYTLYVAVDIYEEMKLEAERQDRTVSWMVEHCWRLSRERIQQYPGVTELYAESRQQRVG
jgi:uncharacterized small protein (TIGR04563 family)